jgi:hypothetical protein
MSSANKLRGTRSGVAESSPGLRLLLMSENSADLMACKDLLRLPGCRVQTCSNYIELLLHLQHEAFQLVIMFQGENAPPEWQSVVKQAAEASGGTPILVFKRSEELTDFSERLAG